MAADEPTDKAKVAVFPDPDRIRARIHHHLRTCSAAVKRARTFEVQRTIKKLKVAKVEEQNSLESQLEALKSSHHGFIAAIAIKHKLTKVKLLPKTESDDDHANTEDYPLLQCIEELDKTVDSTQHNMNSSEAAEKAKARLLSNKIVSEEVSKVVKELSGLIQGQAVSKEQEGARVRSQREETAKADVLKPRKIESSSNLAEDESNQPGSDAYLVGKSMGDSKEDEKLADEALQRPTLKNLSMSASTRVKKRSAEESGIINVSEPKKQQKREDEQESITDSDEDFSKGVLPALSTGFVGGRGFNLGRDSDDEWSDGDADLESIDEDADGSGKQKEGRKNRMGQRARRAIWEKKFGKGANHLKLQEREAKGRANSKPSFARPLAGTGKALSLQRDAGWSGSLGRSAPEKIPQPKSKVEVEMHPSWIAKQREKKLAELAAQSRGKVKKIVFD